MKTVVDGIKKLGPAKRMVKKYAEPEKV